MRSPSLRSAFAVALLALAVLSRAAVYDAVPDFNSTTNPSGPWSYGFTYGTSSDVFVPMDRRENVDAGNGGTVDAWRTSAIDHDDTPLVGIGRYVPYEGRRDWIVLHNSGRAPLEGPPDARAVLHFTAPESGPMRIGGAATGNGVFHLYKNGASILDLPRDAGVAYSITSSLAVGDTLDFTWDGNHGTSFKLLQARIAPVPEPASLAALGLGAVALIRRRRKA